MKLYAYELECGLNRCSLGIAEVEETAKLYRTVDRKYIPGQFNTQVRKDCMDKVVDTQFSCYYYSLTRDDETILNKLKDYMIAGIDRQIDALVQKKADINTINEVKEPIFLVSK